MKKQIITIMLVVMFVSFVTAGVLTTYNSTLKVDKKTKEQLTKMNLVNIEKTDCIQINEKFCEFKMFNGDYNLGSHKIPLRFCDNYNETEFKCLSYTYYNEEELKIMIDENSKRWIENFVNVSIQRENKNLGDIKVKGGTITVNEKK